MITAAATKDYFYKIGGFDHQVNDKGNDVFGTFYNMEKINKRVQLRFIFEKDVVTLAILNYVELSPRASMLNVYEIINTMNNRALTGKVVFYEKEKTIVYTDTLFNSENILKTNDPGYLVDRMYLGVDLLEYFYADLMRENWR